MKTLDGQDRRPLLSTTSNRAEKDGSVMSLWQNTSHASQLTLRGGESATAAYVPAGLVGNDKREQFDGMPIPARWRG